jgi:sulfide:quinone oxidoreductase
MLYAERGIETVYRHVMTAIDPVRKIATYETPDGARNSATISSMSCRRMRAPQAVRNSPLPWQDGPLAADGWVEADRQTMRHPRYDNVFVVGDIAGVPKGKTAASVKWQVPVAADHLVGTISGTPATSSYNGYTSCPLITRIGRAMLIEFDYDDNLVQSFPGSSRRWRNCGCRG